MKQGGEEMPGFEPVIPHYLWEEYKTKQVLYQRGGHGGGPIKIASLISLRPQARRI